MSKVSQLKTLTNIEKGKLLRERRKSLDLSQQEMAKVLGLDPSYLSQLENGRRPVDDWYLTRASEIEKSKSVKEDSLYSTQGTREKCHQYLNLVLDACEGNEDRLSWTYVELQKHFPVSSEPLSEMQKIAKRAGEEFDARQKK